MFKLSDNWSGLMVCRCGVNRVVHCVLFGGRSFGDEIALFSLVTVSVCSVKVSTDDCSKSYFFDGYDVVVSEFQAQF